MIYPPLPDQPQAAETVPDPRPKGDFTLHDIESRASAQKTIAGVIAQDSERIKFPRL